MAAQYQDFSWLIGDGGFLTVNLTPPVPIGGRSIQFDCLKRLGGSGFFSRYSSSGLDNVSGIQITNSGQGSFNVTLNSIDTSGFDAANYAYQIRLTDQTPVKITEGFVLLEP